MSWKLALTTVFLAVSLTLADAYNNCATRDSMASNLHKTEVNDTLYCPVPKFKKSFIIDKKKFCCQSSEDSGYFCCDSETFLVSGVNLDNDLGPFQSNMLKAVAIVGVMICIGLGLSIMEFFEQDCNRRGSSFARNRRHPNHGDREETDETPV